MRFLLNQDAIFQRRAFSKFRDISAVARLSNMKRSLNLDLKRALQPVLASPQKNLQITDLALKSSGYEFDSAPIDNQSDKTPIIDSKPAEQGLTFGELSQNAPQIAQILTGTFVPPPLPSQQVSASLGNPPPVRLQRNPANTNFARQSVTNRTPNPIVRQAAPSPFASKPTLDTLPKGGTISEQQLREHLARKSKPSLTERISQRRAMASGERDSEANSLTSQLRRQTHVKKSEKTSIDAASQNESLNFDHVKTKQTAEPSKSTRRAVQRSGQKSNAPAPRSLTRDMLQQVRSSREYITPNNGVQAVSDSAVDRTARLQASPITNDSGLSEVPSQVDHYPDPANMDFTDSTESSSTSVASPSVRSSAQQTNKPLAGTVQRKSAPSMTPASAVESQLKSTEATDFNPIQQSIVRSASQSVPDSNQQASFAPTFSEKIAQEYGIDLRNIPSLPNIDLDEGHENLVTYGDGKPKAQIERQPVDLTSTVRETYPHQPTAHGTEGVALDNSDDSDIPATQLSRLPELGSDVSHTPNNTGGQSGGVLDFATTSKLPAEMSDGGLETGSERAITSSPTFQRSAMRVPEASEMSPPLSDDEQVITEASTAGRLPQVAEQPLDYPPSVEMVDSPPVGFSGADVFLSQSAADAQIHHENVTYPEESVHPTDAATSLMQRQLLYRAENAPSDVTNIPSQGQAEEVVLRELDFTAESNAPAGMFNSTPNVHDQIFRSPKKLQKTSDDSTSVSRRSLDGTSGKRKENPRLSEADPASDTSNAIASQLETSDEKESGLANSPAPSMSVDDAGDEGIDLPQLATDLLPLVKRLLEVEAERL